MKELEDSTINLIYRRRLRSFRAGYVIMVIISGMVIALPMIDIDIVTSAGGMIRPLKEPAEIFSPISGTIDSTILSNNRLVESGDTVVWMERNLPDTRIREYFRLLQSNERSLSDISAILNGDPPSQTTRYIQSYTSHLATLRHMKIRESFLQKEYITASELFSQEIIPSHEFELAKSNYHIVTAKINDLNENYRKQLAEELNRLLLENDSYSGEIALINSALKDYYIIAPETGTVNNCPGLTRGSVIQPGKSLGVISPSGSLVAECYLAPANITGICPGTRVKLRFNGHEQRDHGYIETTVDQISSDVIVLNGEPVYRVRCGLKTPWVYRSDGTREPVIKGMTFTASILRFRQSLGSLLLERVNRWANPSMVTSGQS